MRRFDSLPLLDGLDGLLLGEDSAGEFVKIDAVSVAQAAVDSSMVSLVLSKKTTEAALLSHLNNGAIHQPINDAVTSYSSLWSSAKINDVISSGTGLDIDTDDIVEGAVNKFVTRQYVDSRVQLLSSSAEIDYDELAGRVASLMMGFSETLVEFELFSSDSESLADMSFQVLPGVQTVTLTAPSTNSDVVSVSMPYSKLFATFVTIGSGDYTSTGTFSISGITMKFSPGASIVITKAFIPRLSLDAFESGDTNKLFTNTEFNNSGLVYKINQHLSDSNFSRYHIEIADTDTYSTTRCWSSFKTESRIREQFDSYSPRSTNKEMALIWCRANQGLNATNHWWTSVQQGSGLWHHYIRRPLNQSSHHDMLSWSTSGSITLRPGKYHVSWQVSEAVRNVTNVQSIGTYLGTTSGWNTKLLDHPGAVTVNANTNVCLWTLIVTPDPYVSSWQNSWLTPRNVPGMQEVYASLFAERIQ